MDTPQSLNYRQELEASPRYPYTYAYDLFRTRIQPKKNLSRNECLCNIAQFYDVPAYDNTQYVKTYTEEYIQVIHALADAYIDIKVAEFVYNDLLERLTKTTIARLTPEDMSHHA